MIGTDQTDLGGPPKKVPWWLTIAGLGVLALAPVCWLLFGHFAATRNPAPAPGPASGADFDQQLELSRTLLVAHRAQESLAPLARCKQLRPNAASVYNNLCVAYGQLEQRDDAVAACVRALQLDPKNQLTKNNLAWVSHLPSKASQH